MKRRGVDYFSSGRVKIEEGDQEVVRAWVHGTDRYRVVLELKPARQSLQGSCTCPYFEDRFAVCKHIWAVLVGSSVEGHLAAAQRVRGLKFEPVWPAYDDDPSDPGPAAGPAVAPSGAWRVQLEEVGTRRLAPRPEERAWLRGRRRVLYVVDAEGSRRDGAVTIELCCQDRKKNGEWGALKQQAPGVELLGRLPEARDRELLAIVAGARDRSGAGWTYGTFGRVPRKFTLPASVLPSWLRLATDTGRLFLRPHGRRELTPLAWDAGAPWQLGLEVVEEAGTLKLRGRLARDGERAALSDPALLSAAGTLFLDDRVALFDHGGAFAWVPLLRRRGEIEIPASDGPELVEALLALPKPPAFELPEPLRYEETQGTPRPRLVVTGDGSQAGYGSSAEVHLTFDYGGRQVASDDPRRAFYERDPPRLVLRDLAAEEGAADRLRKLGVRWERSYSIHDTGRQVVAERRLPALAATLVAEAWWVEVEGARYLQPSGLDLQVSSASDIDWFELDGMADFDGRKAPFPAILRALRKGESMIRLDDGSLGMLPQEWLERYGSLADLGTLDRDGVRFRSSQIGLLDALLAAQPEIDFDRTVAKARKRLAGFDGVRPRGAPRTFRGKLRPYQRQGLGWLHFLRTFGFGGCLADDMGLGKTVQVLALLESRRRERVGRPEVPASLVVVPRSLLFNWQREAERFTPRIDLLVHSGPQREKGTEHLGGHDIVLTTYGTLRRDVPFLKDYEFDYAILDEAQAIKNERSATAKAARLLTARYRLAMTGTPVENHLGELLSLFRFLVPGLLGPGRARRAPKGLPRTLDDRTSPTVRWIAGAVRPFILRRTKEEVAPDLPPKTEQTLYCELPPGQRKDYDELRRHYRQALLGRDGDRGVPRSKIEVLEALLRLRQAACHPGLLDAGRRGETSAKLEQLLPQLEELVAEGHKALVFSQFTSMLAIVRARLEAAGLAYEYLDGRTRKREERVERFQTDPGCPLFLISLKAGGLGLNLTAAEYVFLLDPWWNPAVEAQAVDRAHRIGQTRRTFAYRLIARDTVEEKILELQRSKRELAEAVVAAGSGPLRDLTREDLALLLS